MLISIRARIAFLAMPKSGTTALEKALTPICDLRFDGPPQIKHMNYKQYERFILPYIRSLNVDIPETFAVVREPLDWLWSWYRYRSRPNIPDPSKSTKDVSFADFVEEYLTLAPQQYAKLGSAANFICDQSGWPSVTHLYKYENMAAAIEFLEGRFGKPLDLPKANVSPSASSEAEDNLPSKVKSRLRTERSEDFMIYKNLAQ